MKKTLYFIALISTLSFNLMASEPEEIIKDIFAKAGKENLLNNQKAKLEVESHIDFAEMTKSILKDEVSKQPLIENYFRFDIFKKDGKTSYAYRFVFQSYEKTLTEDETKSVMGEIANVLVGEGFEVR